GSKEAQGPGLDVQAGCSEVDGDPDAILDGTEEEALAGAAVTGRARGIQEARHTAGPVVAKETGDRPAEELAQGEAAEPLPGGVDVHQPAVARREEEQRVAALLEQRLRQPLRPCVRHGRVREAASPGDKGICRRRRPPCRATAP